MATQFRDGFDNSTGIKSVLTCSHERDQVGLARTRVVHTCQNRVEHERTCQRLFAAKLIASVALRMDASGCSDSWTLDTFPQTFSGKSITVQGSCRAK